MTPLERLVAIRNKLASLQSEVNRAEGGLAEVQRRIKEDFACSSLEEARVKLKKLKRVERKVSRKLVSGLEEFQSKWKDLLA